MENYIEIELGSSYLVNAGICGLLKLLKYARAVEDKDYIVNGQALLLAKDFVLSNDLADLFVKTMVKNFKETTKFMDVLNKRNFVNGLYDKTDEFNDDELESINKIYKEFVQTIEKNSFKSGYIILDKYTSINQIDLNTITDFKKEKDIYKKKNLYDELCASLEQPDVQDVLIFKELMYSKINMFYDSTSFYLPANLKKDIKECYRKDFIQPLEDEISSKKIKKKRCIECSNLAVETKVISFMIDSTDDVNRKKSHYWNQKPDAFVCPVCAFLYTLVPLGFKFLGRDAIFINNNNSVETMYRIMDTYDNKDENVSNKSKFFRAFTEEKINMIKPKINNIQIIIKSQGKNHYEMNVIGKDIVENLVKGKKYLKGLERKYVKKFDNFISVYDEVINNILFSRNQYGLIHELFLNDLKTNNNTNYLKDILILQIIFKGGMNLDNIKKNVDIAWKVGIAMRNKLTETVQEKDVDNNLRGLVYKLSNALSVGNCEQFLDSVIRVYSGRGLPIPYIFKECYESEEMFKAIGQGFILGLKYSRYEKNNEIQNA